MITDIFVNVVDIELYNVLEANAIDDIRGKWEDNIRQFSSKSKGIWACQFPKTCKKIIKSLRKLLKKQREVELKVIKKYILN